MATLTHQRKVEFSCHFCGSRLIRRTSWLAHPFLRQAMYQCDLPVCGASFASITELTHLASPSLWPCAKPCPLPLTPNHLQMMARRVHQMNLATRQMDLLDEQEETAQ